MSETLSTARINVRYMLNDVEPSNFAVSSMTLDRIILNKSVELGARVGTGLVWTASGVTLTVGSLSDYSLEDGAVQFERIVAGRINATGATMERVSFALINAAREGLISTASQADPTQFALWEDATQVVKMRVDTVPSTARTIDFMRSTLPLRTVADSTLLPFSNLMLVAVEKAAAVEAAAALPEEELARLRLGARVIGEWQQDVERILVSEFERQASFARRNYGVGAILGS